MNVCADFSSPTGLFSHGTIVRPYILYNIYICIYDSFPAALRFPRHPLGVSLRRQNENRRTGKTGYNSLLHNICVHIRIQGESSRFHVYSFNRREETGKPRQATLYAMIIYIYYVYVTPLRGAAVIWFLISRTPQPGILNACRSLLKRLLRVQWTIR